MKRYFTRLRSKTNAEEYYVGEWHSHPRGDTSPSNTDIDTYEKIIKDERNHLSEVIVLIVGDVVRKQPKINVSVHSSVNGLLMLNPIE